MTEMDGKLLNGRYRLIEPVGAGGMGKVWRGRDEVLDRDVAIKEILFPHSMPPSERKVLGQRAMREARSAARLNHPGIVTVHDVITCDDAPIIVMEFIDGSSLAQVIEREKRLASAEVARIGTMMLEALSEAHAAGIVHRDLKPANVLLTGNRVIITDFGIASLAGDATLTASGMLIGTPAFMAPEQVHNMPVTAAGDLWSLGATLYAAVEGRPPYTGTNLMAVLAAMIAREPDPPVHAGPLAPILTGLLRKDPAERLDAEQASRALAAVTAAQSGRLSRHTAPSRSWAPPSASKASAWPAFERPPDEQLGALDTATRRHRFSPPPEGPGQGRNGDVPASAQPAAAQGIRALPRRRVLLLAGLGAIAAAGVPAAVVLTRDQEPSLSRPRQWTLAANLTGHTWEVTALAFSPDGKVLASGSGDKAVRLWDVAARKIASSLIGDPQGVHTVAFSPDGTALASGGGSDTVLVRDAAGQRTVATLTGHTEGVYTAVFSPDGKSLASSDREGTLRLWNVAAQRAVATLDGSVYTVAFSPDGTILAGGGFNGEVLLWDVATQKTITTLTGGTQTINAVAFSPDGKTLAFGGGDETVELWDVAERKRISTFEGHIDHVYAVAFSPDGKILASGSGDKAVRLWDVTARKPIVTLTGHTAGVHAVVFSPDGTTLASGGEDKLIRLWRIG